MKTPDQTWIKGGIVLWSYYTFPMKNPVDHDGWLLDGCLADVMNDNYYERLPAWGDGIWMVLE